MLALTVVAASCVTNRQDLVKTGHVVLRRHATGKVHVIWCSAYEKDNEFIVTGTLRRRDTVGMPIAVRVDVKIIAPDGRILDEGCSSTVRVSRRIVGRYTGFKRFTVRFSEVPPRGSSLSVVARSGVTRDSANVDKPLADSPEGAMSKTHGRLTPSVHREPPGSKDHARNNFPFWRPNFTISLAAPQSRNPHRRIATPPAPLNRSRPNLRQTWTSNSPIYFVHGPKGGKHRDNGPHEPH